ncbi:MAG: prepilin-type N-terminal cleavage/methylation domain-containing protein, partial [Planctomycetes bacterium]|nr:prepilin-type N-terminal cleavage/methylation domain-containing protein [Planctomycetota bacterium]
MSTARNNCILRRHKRNARGFTLFEVVLATALAATLLLGVWSLFSIYTRLFEAGQARTESSQLARALLDQLAADLRSAIQDPIPAASSKPRTSAPLRRFTLSGSAHELRLDVLQLTPLEGNPTPVSDSEQLVGELSAARVPELRTVYYTFQQPFRSADPASEDFPGLTRRELDFETPVTEQAVMGGPGALAGGMSGDDALDDPGALGPFTGNAIDDSVIWAPEVVRLDFRYFDGSGWASQWNSLTRKSLPVAVEVTMQLQTVGKQEPRVPVDSEEVAEGLDRAPPATPSGRLYRLLIDLPSSPKYAAPQRVRPPSVRRP